MRLGGLAPGLSGDVPFRVLPLRLLPHSLVDPAAAVRALAAGMIADAGGTVHRRPVIGLFRGGEGVVSPDDLAVLQADRHPAVMAQEQRVLLGPRLAVHSARHFHGCSPSSRSSASMRSMS